MVVDKNQTRRNCCRQIKLGCYSTNAMHIICTFEISICLVNWNRLEHLAKISASSYPIWYHLKLTYNLGGTNCIPLFVHSTLPIYNKNLPMTQIT